MNEKEIKEVAERYIELLSSYEHYMQGMEKVVKKVIETRQELVFLEEKLKEAGAQIKDVE